MIARVVGIFFLFCVGIANGAFLPETNDIPLMDGIVLSETEHFSFDTPAGQILTFEGKTEKDSSEIRSFYDETLVSLGWEKKEQDLYMRGNDTLKLFFMSEKKVRFDILLSNN